MISLLILLVVWVAIGFLVMKNSSSFAMFSRGPSMFEFVLVLPFALLCYSLDKLNKKK